MEDLYLIHEYVQLNFSGKQDYNNVLMYECIYVNNFRILQ